MTRHFCYDVGRHVSDQCFGTPASATTLLLCGQTRSDQCFGTPALCYDTSVLYIPSGTYCAMSYSFLITGLSIPIVI